jgi:hypothetical protein
MRYSLTAFALALAAFAAHAAPPEMTKEGAVRYFCGGIGADERKAMQALEPRANLKLLFVTIKRGGYLAGAEVTISDGKATRFMAVADGPICLLELPTGSYRVTAVIGGLTRSAQVSASVQTGKPREVVFSFPGEAWDGIWASDEEKKQAAE